MTVQQHQQHPADADLTGLRGHFPASKQWEVLAANLIRPFGRMAGVWPAQSADVVYGVGPSSSLGVVESKDQDTVTLSSGLLLVAWTLALCLSAPSSAVESSCCCSLPPVTPVYLHRDTKVDQLYCGGGDGPACSDWQWRSGLVVAPLRSEVTIEEGHRDNGRRSSVETPVQLDDKVHYCSNHSGNGCASTGANSQHLGGIDERVRIAVESDLREMQRAGGVSVAAAPQDSGNRPLLTGKQGRKFTGVFQKLKD